MKREILLMRQTSFSFIKNYRKEFGSSLLEGKRKTMRPLSTNHPLHLVLKSTHKGLFNPGNQSLEKLIRSLTAILAIRIRKSKPHLEKIFDLRPFTRVLSWGRDFKRRDKKSGERISENWVHKSALFSTRPFLVIF